MFEYFLMIFWVNLKNKIIANLLTGLTLAILSSALFKNCLFESNDEFDLSGLEIVSNFVFISDLSSFLINQSINLFYLKRMYTISRSYSSVRFSFLIIKFKSKEILELNLEMKNYRRVNSMYKIRSFRPQIIAIIV
jgi:hypothetical protein